MCYGIVIGIVIIKGTEILGKCFCRDTLGIAYSELVVSVFEGKFKGEENHFKGKAVLCNISVFFPRRVFHFKAKFTTTFVLILLL